ncbi:type IV secretory system conjugative DNA transfer family protein [uncultured Tateyamaria sp.]|uniref:type IV secretory system conjugative DNA transfer family protein n=1 Tax=uncultured Tateyamaria sp. TaxID=455651 RepID=UPI002602C87C|nr:type IV secretory system conjugative DNA transfer family protein [uncultured Tateyamaria sp.]
MHSRILSIACTAACVFGLGAVAQAQQLPAPGTPLVAPTPDCSDPEEAQKNACRGRKDESSSFVLQTVNAPSANVRYEDIVNPNSDFYRRTQSFVPSDPKLRVIYDAARGVGIRAGYADEATRINEIVQRRYVPNLTRRFDFNRLMIQTYVIPPVISRINNVQEASGRLLYFSNSSFEIVKDARLSMEPPRWQSYLVLPVQPIAAPQGLSVETAEEKSAWREGASVGWYAGISEARRGFVTGWNILNRDYGGMIRYHELSRQGVVSLPDLKTEVSRWRVTEGGTRAHRGERTLTLRVAPRFRRP